MTLETRLWIFGLLFSAAFLIVAACVSGHVFDRIDAAASTLRDHGTGTAAIFTLSGRALPLAILGAIAMLAFVAFRGALWIPLVIVASQILSQGAVELVKPLLARARPDDWLVAHDLGFSFPSGHATTAIVFYGAWVLVVAYCLPLHHGFKIAIVAVLIAWMLGIDWSRIALGAHYFSDVLGGTLFGCAWTCALLALLIRFRVPFPSG